MIDTFSIKYYVSKEAYESEAVELLKDTFYNELGYKSKALDLMYRFLYYKIEVINDSTKQVEAVYNFKDFNRKNYKKQNR